MTLVDLGGVRTNIGYALMGYRNAKRAEPESDDFTHAVRLIISACESAIGIARGLLPPDERRDYRAQRDIVDAIERLGGDGAGVSKPADRILGSAVKLVTAARWLRGNSFSELSNDPRLLRQRASVWRIVQEIEHWSDMLLTVTDDRGREWPRFRN